MTAGHAKTCRGVAPHSGPFRPLPNALFPAGHSAARQPCSVALWPAIAASPYALLRQLSAAHPAPSMASTDAALLPENLSVTGPPSYFRGDSRGSSPSAHDLPPPLPPAFNAAALCDQFCSVINGFRGLEPLSSARLKSPSRSVAADATDCRLIEYRGEKIAAFAYRGEYLLCLPQAFELFLKHLVGGLHTVYTKLKRLGISPIVCNVEQVRVLRGLGAIQPGVNRCKLLSCKDFDSLYKDCTTAR